MTLFTFKTENKKVWCHRISSNAEKEVEWLEKAWEYSEFRNLVDKGSVVINSLGKQNMVNTEQYFVKFEKGKTKFGKDPKKLAMNELLKHKY